MKNTKKIYLFLLIPALLLILTACGNPNLTNTKNNTTSGGVTNPLNSSNPTISSSTPKFNGPLTMAELAKHNSKSDCWQLIDGQVYDLSAYTMSGAHPGGDKILNGCGIDASALFNSVGKHNGRARAMLPNYLLGPIQL